MENGQSAYYVGGVKFQQVKHGNTLLKGIDVVVKCSETEYKSCLCSSGNGSKEEKEMSLSSEVHGNNLTFCTENVIRYENLCKSHEVAPPSSGSGFAKDQQLEINKPEAQERKLLEIVLNRNEDRKSEDLGTRISEELGRGLQGVKNYICERGIMLSSVFGKLLNESEDEVQVLHLKSGKEIFQQQNLEDGKVLQRNGGEQLKGRITFFSRSGCPECCAIRSYFRQRHLPFVEVNIDVYPLRRFEVEERTGSTYVPQIFFNDQLLGGIVALNTLRNSGEFEDKLLRVLRNKCPSTAPAPVVYGIDDPEDETPDELVNIVRIMRLKVPIQDRFLKMRLINNCFTGTDAVDILIHELDCGRMRAIEMAKRVARKHFFHHVLQENIFEDGNHLYRFLEHDPIISTKCLNFGAFTNDEEPKAAASVVDRLRKIITAILENYVSDDGRQVDYKRISMSEEFRRYVNMIQDLQRIDILSLTRAERLAFFLNVYNAMVIHIIIQQGYPNGLMERRKFFGEFQYLIGGYSYSLSTIQNGILRANRRPPYGLRKPFKYGNECLEVALPKINIMTHFALCNGSKSSPPIRSYSPEGVDVELKSATRAFFQRDGIMVDLGTRTIYLSKIFKWFSVDFGQWNEMLNWITFYVDATKAGMLSHLLNTSGPIEVVYQNYDWSSNS